MQLTRERTNALILAAALLVAMVAFIVGRSLAGGGETAAPVVPKLNPIESSEAPKVPKFAAAAQPPALRPAPKKRATTAVSTGGGATSTGGGTTSTGGGTTSTGGGGGGEQVIGSGGGE
jgi:hypothetical protein